MSSPHSLPHLTVLQNIIKKKNIKVYLVGGFLRDFVLNRNRTDFDFAVSANALRLARQFSKAIKGAFVLLDQQRGCARVVKKFQGEIFTFDFADFRAKTLKGDLSQRDFTINTLCVDMVDFSYERLKIMDFKGGLSDLKAKRIRMVSPKAFKDDPLRLLRAFSLKAMLDFRIDQETLKQLKKDKDLLLGTSYERIRDELFKILSAPQTAKNLKAMDRLGLLKSVIPQIHVMSNVKQGGYHHLDVWPHSLETVVQFEKILEEFSADEDADLYLNESLAGERKRFALMKLAALLHDIGKPQTRKKEKGRMSFHGHEHVGKNIVRSIAKMLKLSTKERHILEDMVRWHLRPGYLSNFKIPSRRAVFRYFRDTKDEAVSILLLSLADQRSTRGPLTSEHDQRHHEKIVRKLITEYFVEQRKEPFIRLINGDDLIKKLKLKPSPLFAEILKEVEEKQVLGKIVAKKEALDLAKTIVNKNKRDDHPLKN